jgi:hypothetical protein
MSSRVNISMRDAYRQVSPVNLPIAAVVDGAGFTAALDAESDLQAAVAALSLGVLASSSINVLEHLSSARPTDEDARRESAVRFIATDPDTNQVAVSLPCPDFAQFPFAAIGSDTTPYPYAGVNAAVTAMVAAIEQHGRHPISGGALTVIRLDSIGRNN